MTAQMGDTFKYKDNEYSIVAISNPIEFDPKAYGITPEGICSACWAGYWCEYRISQEGIVLQNIFINSKDGTYPPINGVEVNVEKQPFEYMGHHLYRDVSLQMNYSGRIVVGKGFLQEYYVHMGYQRAWAYETLLEFVFEEGNLVNCLDHSNMAEKLREDLKSKQNPKTTVTREDIEAFIEESFSLDMETKTWWI